MIIEYKTNKTAFGQAINFCFPDAVYGEISIVTENIIEAFNSIDRIDFLPDAFHSNAYQDIPFPIGYGQTNSQPSTVAFMLELLQPQDGHKILDVGSGSGWTTAILASTVGTNGKIFAIERIPELHRIGLENVEKYGFVTEGRVQMHIGDGWHGFPEQAPYDRILVSAMAIHVPESLVEQLKVGGILVIPVLGDVCKIVKKNDGFFERENFADFSFVPLVNE